MKNKITKPSAKIATLQLSAYGEIYGINPSLYQKPKPAKTENQVFIDSNPGLLKPWEPKY